MIPVFEPLLGENETRYVNRCLETNWISSQGEYIKTFEERLAAFHGVKHAVVTSNCTTALHLALLAKGLGPGDEVLCPDLTFIAPANMIVLAGAKLVLVDIDPETLTIDPAKAACKITSRTKAIMVVHQFGHAAHMDEIMALAREHGLAVIEDNAESLGGRYRGKLLGTIGDAACLSFFANKIITTGEGGAVVTDDDGLAEKCQILRDHGMSRSVRYHHVDLGYNYRMTNLQAAIGLAQLERLPEILARRMGQMEHYYRLLKEVEGCSLRPFAAWTTPVHWLMTLTLAERFRRDDFIAFMRGQGVDCRQMVNPVHRADHFIKLHDEAEFPNSVRLSTQSVHLPSSTSLTGEQIESIVERVKGFLQTRQP